MIDVNAMRDKLEFADQGERLNYVAYELCPPAAKVSDLNRIRELLVVLLESENVIIK